MLTQATCAAYCTALVQITGNIYGCQSVEACKPQHAGQAEGRLQAASGYLASFNTQLFALAGSNF